MITLVAKDTEFGYLGWLRGAVVERWSLTGELFLSSS